MAVFHRRSAENPSGDRSSMTYTRRDAIVIGAGAVAAASLATPAAALTMEEGVAAFTKGVAPTEGGVTITAPELAENAAAVGIEGNAPGAEAMMFVAPANPTPILLVASFGPAAGSQRLMTRVRLAETQEVMILARMPDGTVAKVSQKIEVTAGGC